MTSAEAAIWYQPDGYKTDTLRIKGRRAAGEAFLKAYVQDPTVANLHCVAPKREEFDIFAEHVQELGANGKACHWIQPTHAQKLGSVGTLFYPSPGVQRLAWQRRRANQRAYSICGVFHTTASHAVMTIISELFTSPVQTWDAIVCTSEPMKAMVEHEIEQWSDFLEDRIGARPEVKLKLPVIPLGVDCAAFAPSDDGARARKEWRERLKIAEGDVSVLYFGRLSYHEKANPYPMYLGLERAAQASGVKVHLIQAGWFGSDERKRHFIDGAHKLCPSVTCSFVNGEDPKVRRTIWYAADIFTSLSDNIQETFGLVPIEGMAAGLPVVVTDWNGYKDTVRDGEDGFRVPTWQPAPGAGSALAELYASGKITYENYVGEASQSTAVDVEACAKAFEQLISDPELRRRMGEAGRARALEVFDWRQVMSSYQDLWAELKDLRAGAPETAPRRPGSLPDPRRDDPFALFAAYPSEQLTLDTSAKVTASGSEQALEQCLDMGILRVLRPRNADQHMRQVFAKLRKAPKTVRELARASKNPQQELRAVGWLAKCGLVSLSNDASAGKKRPKSGKRR